MLGHDSESNNRFDTRPVCPATFQLKLSKFLGNEKAKQATVGRLWVGANSNPKDEIFSLVPRGIEGFPDRDWLDTAA
jgi:hypothetical protein